MFDEVFEMLKEIEAKIDNVLELLDQQQAQDAASIVNVDNKETN